ncbi:MULTISPECIES: zinc-finger domain-containing protein [unclassified Bartonella]|uniref:zinc-finger domain-containing protein n=1 Tax=unclassified Bartonella TaxID=2645622 RepID=UPI0035CFBCE1
MADHNIPHFQNDLGYKTIEIGVKEFMCVGATQPFDHPHIFIDMGTADEKICPYCSTLYRYVPSLSYDQTNPTGCLCNPEKLL